MKELATHIKNLPRSGIRDFFELVIGRDDVISLGVGEPDFPTPWHIREASIFAIENGRTMYTSNLGLIRFREEISQYLSKNYTLEYNPETEILITVGVSEALDIAIRAITNPGDEIIYHTPSYVSYNPTIEMSLGVAVEVVTKYEDNFNIKAQDVEKVITDKTKAILINYPNNPTGAAGNIEELKKIADIANEKDIYVIIDEIYREVVYDNSFISIANYVNKDNMIYLNGFSKAYAMTGYRIGYVCANEVLTESMMKIHQYNMLCASIISQEAGIEALKNGDEEKEVMRSEYERRRNYFVSSLNEIGIECFMPGGAFYVFPNVRNTGLSGKEFAYKLLEKESVAVVPGDAFGESYKHHVRCSYATDIRELEESIKRIKRFLKDV